MKLSDVPDRLQRHFSFSSAALHKAPSRAFFFFFVFSVEERWKLCSIRVFFSLRVCRVRFRGPAEKKKKTDDRGSKRKGQPCSRVAPL